MKAYALMQGRRTIEISKRGTGYLWALAASHDRGKAHWTIGVVSRQDRELLMADGWAVVPIQFEVKK